MDTNSEVPSAAPVLLHVSAVADRLGLSPYQVRKLIDAGRLPAEPVGQRTYVPVAALDRYIESLAS